MNIKELKKLLINNKAILEQMEDKKDVLSCDFIEVLKELKSACVYGNEAKIIDCAKIIDYLNSINSIKKYKFNEG